LDSRRLALERVARKGEAQDGPNNPTTHHVAKSSIEAGRFARMAERVVWTNPLGYSAPPVPRPSGHRLRRCSFRHPASAVDNFVWNKIGQPQAGPGARSAQGWGPRMGRTQIRLEQNWTAV